MSVVVRSGIIHSSRFISCYVDKLHFRGDGHVNCSGLDFSRSTLAECDLAQIGLETATMLETAIIACAWPSQRGHISLLGEYSASPYLLAQPVQDLKGVPPLVRREIADAQYLVRKLEAASSLTRRGMQLWGLFAGFGQSLTRLSLSTLGLISLSTGAVLAARQQLFGVFSPNLVLLGRALDDSFQAFFALAELPAASHPTEFAVLVATRICGFVVLGFWLTIASQKLSRLGAG